LAQRSAGHRVRVVVVVLPDEVAARVGLREPGHHRQAVGEFHAAGASQGKPPIRSLMHGVGETPDCVALRPVAVEEAPVLVVEDSSQTGTDERVA
jgi:hypothetical protein